MASKDAPRRKSRDAAAPSRSEKQIDRPIADAMRIAQDRGYKLKWVYSDTARGNITCSVIFRGWNNYRIVGTPFFNGADGRSTKEAQRVAAQRLLDLVWDFHKADVIGRIELMSEYGLSIPRAFFRVTNDIYRVKEIEEALYIESKALSPAKEHNEHMIYVNYNKHFYTMATNHLEVTDMLLHRTLMRKLWLPLLPRIEDVAAQEKWIRPSEPWILD